MAYKRTFLCLLLLGALILAACAGFSLGQANAHYKNTDAWHTLLPAAAESGPVSNCLVSGGQTVLLGQMPLEQTQVPFTLAGESGSLRWSADAAEYVSIAMLADGVSYTLETALQIPPEGKTVTMVIEPTQAALETVHEAIPVRVEVTWTTASGVYSAVFQLTLPEQTELPTEPTLDPTEPTEDAAEPSEDPTEPSEEATEPSEDPTEPSEEATEPSEDPTEPSEEPTEPTEETTAPAEDPGQPVTLTETEPTQETTAPTEETTTPTTEPTEETTTPTTEPTEETTTPATDPTEETTTPTTDPTEETTVPTDPTEETTVPTDPTEETTAPTEPEEPAESPVSLLLPGAYLTEQGLPLVATFPENTDRLVLQAADAQLGPVPFAPFTRYSTDGENWFLLYYGGSVELTLTPEQTRQTLILEVPAEGQLLLYAEIWDANGSLGHTIASSLPLAQSVLCELPVLTHREELVLQLPEQWRGYEMQYSVSRLVSTRQRTENADGTYTTQTVRAYEPVELTKETLKAAYDTGTEDAPAHTLTFATGTPEEPKVIEQVLPAGTYCVEITWNFEEFCLAQTRTVFFITYSPD